MPQNWVKRQNMDGAKGRILTLLEDESGRPKRLKVDGPKTLFGSKNKSGRFI